MSIYRTMDIYFSDLIPETQKKLLEMSNVTDAKEMNWDMDNMPIGTLEVILENAPMVYKNEEDGFAEILANDYYKDHQFVVRSVGTHPCCYVSILDGVALNPNLISCHGGITYISNYFPDSKDEWSSDKRIDDGFHWWIGWDYTDLGDAFGTSKFGKQWTTEEMIEECHKVIDQICDILGEE